MGDQFCLLCHNILAKILPIFSLIRSITCHKLIDDNSHSIEVSLKAMIFSEQNFRCHVARSATCVLKVIRPFLSCDPKICEVEIAYPSKKIVAISSPSESNTRFSGLMSLCIIPRLWMYSKDISRQATINSRTR
jgi:hypothetical protein